MSAKILIVDDRRENINLLMEILASLDVEILAAESAHHALGLLLENDFSLALLDVQMPQVNGFELARLIRGVKKHKNLPIIFVTAHQQDRSVLLEGYESGAVDLLFKPLDPQVVRGKVRIFVQLAEQSQQLKEQMRELEELRTQAEAANFAKSRFLANMSHEIRTPLGAVLGFSELLSGDSLSAEDREKCREAIKRNGQLLHGLIEDVLDFSRIESGRLQLEEQEFSVRELIKDVSAALGLKASEKGIALSFKVSEELADIYVSDLVRLKQIILNMAGNALKFTEAGEVSVEAGIVPDSRLRSGETRLYFRVKDTGIGLAPDEVERIFQPFTQADSSTKRRFGGSGLGLVISKQLAKSLGGDLVLESSQQGVGSTFLLTVRVHKSASEQRKEPSPEKKSDEDSLVGKKILVVDDVLDNRILVESFLKDTGVIVRSAASGAGALAAIESETIDVALVDLQMPEMDGFETIERIKQKSFPGPIIAFTAHADKADIDRCIRLGCQQVLTKPTSRKRLLGALLQVVN